MSNANPSSSAAHLLTDLQHFFSAQTAKHVTTEQLLTYLTGIHTTSWATLADGKAITARHLARLLQPYGIVSKNIRVGNTVPKCYRADDFKEAFAQLVADNVADNVADIVENNVADRNVAANSGDVADKSGDVAALVENANYCRYNPAIAANVTDKVADIVDVTDSKPVVAAISNVAAPVPAQPVRKWPPPKGWTWNHQTAGYEPPTPTVEAPIDQELIRQTLRVSSSLKYLPGKGLVALHEAEPCLS